MSIDRECWSDLYRIVQEYTPKIAEARQEQLYDLYLSAWQKIGTVHAANNARYPLCVAAAETLYNIRGHL